MKLTDSRGLPVSTQSVAALERYELAAQYVDFCLGVTCSACARSVSK